MQTRRIYISLLWLMCAGLMLGQAACSPQSPAPSSTATASPTPQASPTVDASAMAAASPGAPSAQPAAPPAPASGGASATTASGSSAASPAPVEKPQPPRTFTLASGRVLSIFTSNDLSTKTARAGDRFVGSLARPITDGDWVIAKAGAPVEGVVSRSDPGGRVKGRASLSVTLKSLQLADGRTIGLSTSSYTKEARGTKKKDATKIGIGAGIGAAIGAIAGGGKGAAIGAGVGGGAGTGMVLATRGDPAVISSESQLTFRLSSPVTITKRQ